MVHEFVIDKHVSPSGGTRIFFFCGGYWGGKMCYQGGKNPKICQKWLIWAIFFFWWGGGKWGKSLWLGGRECPMPPTPWCCHWCPLGVNEVDIKKESLSLRQLFIKGVLHLWALFLKVLCIFSKNKATSDKVSYGSGQKCSKELKNHNFTSV